MIKNIVPTLILMISLLIFVNVKGATVNETTTDAFVSDIGKEIIQLSHEASKDSYERLFKKVKVILQKNTEIEKIAKWSLGRVALNVSDESFKQYLDAVLNGITSLYMSSAKFIQSKKFVVLEAVQRGRGYFVVTKLLPSSQKEEEITLEWNVVKDKKTGQFKVRDIVFEGISMIQTFKSFVQESLKKNHNDMDKLISDVNAWVSSESKKMFEG